jgi:hypothetical protein
MVQIFMGIILLRKSSTPRNEPFKWRRTIPLVAALLGNPIAEPDSEEKS